MVSGGEDVVVRFDMGRLLTYHELGPAHSSATEMSDQPPGLGMDLRRGLGGADDSNGVGWPAAQDGELRNDNRLRSIHGGRERILMEWCSPPG